jgi:hypothetical protein
LHRIKRALAAGVGTLGLLSGAAGVAAIIAPTAAHATTNEAYVDATATSGCEFFTCGNNEDMKAASNHLVDVAENSATTWAVSFNGHWCLADANGFMGVDSNGALIDNYSSSCNLGGDEWTIHCTGVALEFELSNVHTGNYVTPNVAGVYHANNSGGGDVFEDTSGTECP